MADPDAPTSVDTGLPSTPTGWTLDRAESVGPFAVRARYHRSDGTTVEWNARSHRKHPGGGVVPARTW